jgi:1-aminocyclopropane-1-carboxylate deaminase/D-cysteine desulfhydrase-like pyridoxal-dependent ACC family enzyme
MGVEIYVKRDDLTGMELSGNKIRKIEYIMADAPNPAPTLS